MNALQTQVDLCYGSPPAPLVQRRHPPALLWLLGLEGWGPGSQKLLDTLQHADVRKHGTEKKTETFFNSSIYKTQLKKKTVYSYLIAFHVVVSDLFFPDNCSHIGFLTHLLGRWLPNINSPFLLGLDGIFFSGDKARSPFLAVFLLHGLSGFFFADTPSSMYLSDLSSLAFKLILSPSTGFATLQVLQ